MISNQDSRGYGELNLYQKAVVDKNLDKIRTAKDDIDLSLHQVTDVKRDFLLLQEGVSVIGSSFILNNSDNKTSDVEKKIWSNMSTNVKGIEGEKIEIEKALRVLEKYASNYERNISQVLLNLQKLTDKVESLKQDSGWGFLNWMFGQTKTTRVRESNVDAEVAVVKASEADLQVKELTGRKDILNKEINELFMEQIELKNTFNGRVELARDVGKEITAVKSKYNSLLIKYEVRQKTFLNYSIPAKIKNEDKAEILSGLNRLKTEISNFEVLEKRVGDEKVMTHDEESTFIKSVKDSLLRAKESFDLEAINTQGLISNTLSEKMGLMDKIWSSVSSIFSFSSEKKLEGLSEIEIKVVEKMYNESISDDEGNREVSNVLDTDDNVDRK